MEIERKTKEIVGNGTRSLFFIYDYANRGNNLHKMQYIFFFLKVYIKKIVIIFHIGLYRYNRIKRQNQ